MDTLCYVYRARTRHVYQAGCAINPAISDNLLLRFFRFSATSFLPRQPPMKLIWHTRAHDCTRVHIYSFGIRERAHEIYDINHTRVVDPCQPAELDGNGNIIYYVYINNKSDKSKGKKKRILFILFFDINKMYYLLSSVPRLSLSPSGFVKRKKIYI